MIHILITDEINICIVEFNYYAENYTLETNFSHIISSESHTEAASWIVRLSSDSPDINLVLDPNQISMKPEDEFEIQSSVELSPSLAYDSLSISPSYTASLTCDSQGIPVYSLYIGVAIFIVLFAIMFMFTGIFALLYFCKRPEPKYAFHDDLDDTNMKLENL